MSFSGSWQAPATSGEGSEADMITLNAVRTAILSDDPYTLMDRLVRNELSAGRTTRQITNDLNPLIDDALATPGLTEDGEESLLGVLDALTGNCHRDCQY